MTPQDVLREQRESLLQLIRDLQQHLDLSHPGDRAVLGLRLAAEGLVTLQDLRDHVERMATSLDAAAREAKEDKNEH